MVEGQAVLAPGSLLPPGRLIPRGQLWAGAPARYVRDLTADEVIPLLLLFIMSDCTCWVLTAVDGRICTVCGTLQPPEVVNLASQSAPGKSCRRAVTAYGRVHIATLLPAMLTMNSHTVQRAAIKELAESLFPLVDARIDEVLPASEAYREAEAVREALIAKSPEYRALLSGWEDTEVTPDDM